MSLWKRRQQPDYGQIEQVSQQEGPVLVLSSDPYSDQFDESGIIKPKDLVNYLLSEQKKRFASTILEQFSYPILLANAKRLMGKYSVGILKRSVKIAVNISQHPFSFKLVEQICQNNLQN